MMMLSQLTPLAVGRTAEIFSLPDGKVVKLFRPWCPSRFAHEEAEKTRAVRALGLPVPYVHELLEIEGRAGFIMELITGESMLTEFFARSRHCQQLAQIFASVHARIHSCQATSIFPTRHEQLRWALDRLPDVYAGLRDVGFAALRQLPPGDRVCHNDFHPGNVICSASGPVVIDWEPASSGDPVADVARTIMMIRLGQPPEALPDIQAFEFLRATILETYLVEYRRFHPLIDEQLNSWLLPVAIARLHEEIPGELTSLLALIETLIQ